MDKCTHEVRLAQWTRIIQQCQNRPQGQPACQWLKENGINSKSYYYWLRKVRKNTYDQAANTANASLSCIQSNETTTPNITFAEIPFRPDTSSSELSYSFQPVAVIKSKQATVAFSDSISDRLLTRILQEVSHA